MPRPARLNLPGRLYHVISRFIDRQWLVLDDDDRATYLRMLEYALRQSDWRCLAYALMSNHLHLAMVGGELPMSSWTRSAHSRFAQWINDKRKRIGPVFANRATDYEVLPANEGSVIAYIHNNPVRANVASCASESLWTSHRAYLGVDAAPAWLGVAEGLQRSRFDEPRDFDAWVNAQGDEQRELETRALRRAIYRRGGLNTATPEGGRVAIVARVFSHVRVDPRDVVHVVAELANIRDTAFRSRRRSAKLVEARRVVVRVGKELGLCGSDIAAALGISAGAVSRMAGARLSEDGTRQAAIAIDVLRYRK